MNTALIILAMVAGVFILVVPLLSLLLFACAAVWRLLPLPQRAHEASFVIAAVLLITPVPLGLGVGGWLVPISVRYFDHSATRLQAASLVRDPALLVLAAITALIAYFMTHTVLPKKEIAGEPQHEP